MLSCQARPIFLFSLGKGFKWYPFFLLRTGMAQKSKGTHCASIITLFILSSTRCCSVRRSPEKCAWLRSIGTYPFDLGRLNFLPQPEIAPDGFRRTGGSQTRKTVREERTEFFWERNEFTDIRTHVWIKLLYGRQSGSSVRTTC